MKRTLPVIALALLALTACGKGETETAAEKAENKRKGFHCLSAWDGSHRNVVEVTKKALNDPDSFDHVETLVAPVSEGKHRFKMTYRAKNGFGAIVLGSVSGYFSNDGCEVLSISQGG